MALYWPTGAFIATFTKTMSKLRILTKFKSWETGTGVSVQIRGITTQPPAKS